MLPRDVQIEDLTIEHYHKAVALWRSDMEIGLSSADAIEGMGRFLRRNHGLSKVLIRNGELIGTVLCGHDGRRGYIYHLYIQPDQRRSGMATGLVNACVDGLRREGIHKCHLFIFKNNESGKKFWASILWQKREDIEVFSRDI